MYLNIKYLLVVMGIARASILLTRISMPFSNIK